MSTFVPTLCWVPKGVSKEKPDKVVLSPDKVQKLVQNAHQQLEKLGLDEALAKLEEDAEGEEEEEEGEESISADDGSGEDDMGEIAEEKEEEEDIEKLYDMEHYDSEGEGEGQKVSGAGMGNNLAGLTFYPSNESDPYITLKNMPPEEEDEDDFSVLPSDNLLVVGRAEEDFSSVEVHVYNDGDDHSYSHHEIMLTAFPLSLEWLDYDPEQPDQKGNYLAIGTMTPVIEVWDLDTVDVLEPVFCLGDPNIISGIANLTKDEKTERTVTDKKELLSSKLEATPTSVEGHTHSVLGLSWNMIIRSILASASADHTVRVWDLAWPKSVLTLKHPDKVQCCVWHPFQPELLATGAYDGVVRVFNCKSSESAARSWKLGAVVERILWDHFKSEHLLACSEEKTVWCFNKNDGSTVFQIHAHDTTITDLSLSCHMPGLLVTASDDDTVKFWDIHEDKPVFLMSRDMHMGSVMCAKFCVDSPYSLAVGGRKNGFHIIDVAKLLPVVQRFRKRDLLMPVRNSKSSSATDKSNGVQAKEKNEEMEVDEEITREKNGDNVQSSSVRTKPAKSESKVSHKKKKKSSKPKTKKVHH